MLVDVWCPFVYTTYTAGEKSMIPVELSSDHYYTGIHNSLAYSCTTYLLLHVGSTYYCGLVRHTLTSRAQSSHDKKDPRLQCDGYILISGRYVASRHDKSTAVWFAAASARNRRASSRRPSSGRALRVTYDFELTCTTVTKQSMAVGRLGCPHIRSNAMPHQARKQNFLTSI